MEEEKGPPPVKKSCPKCDSGFLEVVDAAKICDECDYVEEPKREPTWREARAQEYWRRSKGAFESEVLRYLRNSSGKITRTMNDVMTCTGKMKLMQAQLEQMQSQIEVLQTTVLDLGQANGTAYNQLKEVVNSIGSSTKQIVDDLSDCMGNVRFVDWDTYGDVEQPII